MAASDILREQLLALIDGLDSRMPFEAAVADFPEEAINTFRPMCRTRPGISWNTYG